MQYDKDMAARVWKRVQGASTPEGERPQEPAQGLWEMIREEWQDAQVYQHLAKQYAGKQRQMLLEMARQERSHVDCLKGIYALITGKSPQVPKSKPELGSVDMLLRRCYGREMQCLAHYESKSENAQYGRVFRELAEQERRHCRAVLELLGSMGP